MDDFLEYGDSSFFVSDGYIEIKEKNAQSRRLLFCVAFPPLLIIFGLFIFFPETGSDKPIGYVILGMWFLVGMYAYLYCKKIIIDLQKNKFLYKTSVLGFPFTDISRKISDIEEIGFYSLNKSDSNDKNGPWDHVLFFKVNGKSYEINTTGSKEAIEQQKYFFKDLIGL